MQDENENEKLLILPLGDESKKIAQVMSNDTARSVLNLLADTPLSASDIAERLETPLTTITYNLENLEKAGLIKIDRIKYSEKGREVKLYTPSRKIIVVVPQQTDKTSIPEILRRYLGIIFLTIFASGMLEVLAFRLKKTAATFSQQLTAIPVGNETIWDAAEKSSIRGANMTTETLPTPMPRPLTEETVSTFIQASPLPGMETATASIAEKIVSHPGIWFLLGALFTIILISIIEYRKNRK